MIISSINVNEVSNNFQSYNHKVMQGKDDIPTVDDITHDTSVLCSNVLTDDTILTSDYGIYIFTKSPSVCLKRLAEEEPHEGINIVTIIADSNLLYKRHSAKMITDFLVKEAYLNETQKTLVLNPINKLK